MNKIAAEWPKYQLGTVLFVAILLGGSAASGVLTDALLQFLLILASAPVLASSGGQPINRKTQIFCGLILAAILIQLIPLPASLTELVRSEAFLEGRIEAGGGPNLITLGLGRTVENLTYVSALILLMFAMSRLSGAQVHALLPFLLAGIACQALAGAIQYAGTDRVRIDGVLPYTITAGSFANRNHFVSLLYVSIPFLVYLGTFRGMRLWSGLGQFMVLIVLLAAGSRAGVAIGLSAIILSYLFIASHSRYSVTGLGILIFSSGIYAMGAWTKFEQGGTFDEDARWTFAANTIEGFKENWLFGVGYGNFSRAFQLFEDRMNIGTSYVNHAHNDYLQIAFEGGIIGVTLMIVYFVTISFQLILIRYNNFQKAAFLSIIFILMHSWVDYPLRTISVGATFALLNVILFHPALQPRPEVASHYIKVRHGRRKLAVPMEPADQTTST